MTPRTMNTLDSVISRSKFHGSHFFDKETMQFFRSRLHNTVYPAPHGTYFISSERHVDPFRGIEPRLYTVRYMDTEGKFHSNASDFGEFRTGHEAHKVARYLQVLGHRTCLYQSEICAHDRYSTEGRSGSLAKIDEREGKAEIK
jgi:hypothetical protein